jgi:hypothetical protein
VTIPAPEARVRAYLDRVDQAQAAWPEGHYNHPDDEVDRFVTSERLTLGDLRDVLNELAAARDDVVKWQEHALDADTRVIPKLQAELDAARATIEAARERCHNWPSYRLDLLAEAVVEILDGGAR